MFSFTSTSMKIKMVKHAPLIAILILWNLGHPVVGQTLTKFTAAKCLALDPSALKIDFCFIKAYSRTKAVFNLGLTLSKPVYKPLHVRFTALLLNSNGFTSFCFQFHVIVNYRYGNVFHQVINSKQFEWCNAMSPDGFNPIGKLMVLLLSDSIPQLFHPCPYEVKILKTWRFFFHILVSFQGKVDLHNISFNDLKWPSVWPSGRYKIDLNITFNLTPAIYLFFTTETKSPLNTGSFS